MDLSRDLELASRTVTFHQRASKAWNMCGRVACLFRNNCVALSLVAIEEQRGNRALTCPLHKSN